MLRIVFLLALAFGKLAATPLDDYIARKDHHYQWAIERKVTSAEADIIYVDLTSQQWREASEVDKPLWKHKLVIAIPKKLSSKTAILTIGGGTEGQARSSTNTIGPLELALSTQAVACELSLVPNQCLKFCDEKDSRYCATGRREDALVAYTWDKFLTTGDTTWPLQLPMTKSVVRAMDAVTALLKQELNWQTDGFILIGASKRGWTAWTTAATDKRVKAIIPIAIDVLNVKQSYERHYAAYGNWSLAVKDYVDMHIGQRMDSSAFRALMQFIDPASYLDRLLQPKYILNASGDEFFLPDSSRLYFKQLSNENRLLYLPNTGHHILPDLYKETMIAYLKIILDNGDVPSATWEIRPENMLSIAPSKAPVSAILWQAHNPEGRDFRIHTIGSAWQATTLTPTREGSYCIPLSLPEKGWAAYFVEMHFQTAPDHLFKISTDVFVLPELLPHL